MLREKKKKAVKMHLILFLFSAYKNKLNNLKEEKNWGGGD